MEMMPQILSDRYQIIYALGAGGFGETFLAEDIKMPSRRRCVIKRLKPITDNPEIHQLVKERFSSIGGGRNRETWKYIHNPLIRNR